MVAAEERLSELAGGICVWNGRGHFLALDNGYGVSGVCGVHLREEVG